MRCAGRTPSPMASEVRAAAPASRVAVVARAVSEDVLCASPGCPAAVVSMQKAQLQRWQAHLVRSGHEQRG